MGFGTSPLGSFPFGYGEPEEAPAPPTLTGLVRDIGQETGDYSIDAATGGMTRTTAVRQRVWLALKTIAGSSTVQRDWGVKRPPKMGKAFEAEVESAVRKALQQLSDVEKLITVESVTVERGGGGRSRATVHFRDLTTRQTDSIPVIVG